MSAGPLIIIPARGGSKRLPGKNLKRLGGRSLIAWTADAARAGLPEATPLLSTDDADIAAEGRALGLSVPFLRPAELSTDAATTADAVLHALDWVRDREGADPAALMVLQPTSPFRGPRCLAAAVETLAERGDIDSIVGVTALPVPANKLFETDARGHAVPVSDRAVAPVHVPNGALYLVRTAAFRATGSLYAGTVLPFLFGRIRSLDIDTAEDWTLAEATLAAGLPDEPVSFLPIGSGGLAAE